MGFGCQEIDKTLDLGYIRVAGLSHQILSPLVVVRHGRLSNTNYTVEVLGLGLG